MIIDGKHFIEQSVIKLNTLTLPSEETKKDLSPLSAWAAEKLDNGYDMTIGYNQPDKVSELEQKHFQQKLKSFDF